MRVSYTSTSALNDPADTVDYLSFGYDTAGRLTNAQTYGPRSEPALMSEVKYTYDARGNLTGETLDPAGSGTPLAKSVSYGWDWTMTGIQRDQLNSITYPSGSRKFDYTYDTGTWYDQIGRMTGLALNGGPPIIHYDTTGGGRNIIQTWGDAKVKLDYHPSVDNPNPSLFDRFGRVKTMDTRKMTSPTTSTRIHKYEYGYDGNGNRIFNRNEQVGHIDERDYLYGYDRLNRLIFAERGEVAYNNGWKILNFGKGRAWALDLLGNWSGDLDSNATGNQSVIDYTTRAGSTPGYTQDTDDLDAFTYHETDESNAIKKHSYDHDGDTETASVDSDFYYDDAGNLVLDDEKFYKFDAWNRIVGVFKNDHATNALIVTNGILVGEPGSPVASYDYDALGRRTSKTLGSAASPTDYFYYDGHRVIEHHSDDGTGMALNKQYVYGVGYIDELVAYYKSEAPATTPHFVLQDANYDVVGITDDQGTLVQQMALDPYGNHLYIEDGDGLEYDGVDADISMLETPFGRNALWFDPETGLYYVRARYYDPVLGRWRQRDPKETGLACGCGLSFGAQAASARVAVSPSGQFGDGMSLYQYAQGSPVMILDPTGLETEICGPDVTSFLGKLIQYSYDWRNRQGDVSGGQARAWLKVWGGAFDWENLRTRGCPKGKRCQKTYTLCGECVHDHWIGNFMITLVERQLDVWDITGDAAAQYVQITGENPALDSPWDRAGYGIARRVHTALKSQSAYGFCGLLKIDRQLWDTANNPRVMPETPLMRPSGHSMGSMQMYPAPRSKRSDYKNCKPCAENYDAKLPGGTLQTVGFPDIDDLGGTSGGRRGRGRR